MGPDQAAVPVLDLGVMGWTRVTPNLKALTGLINGSGTGTLRKEGLDLSNCGALTAGQSVLL